MKMSMTVELERGLCVLYCDVFYSGGAVCSVVLCTVLYCTVLYCTVLYCTVLYCILYSIKCMYHRRQRSSRTHIAISRKKYESNYFPTLRSSTINKCARNPHNLARKKAQQRMFLQRMFLKERSIEKALILWWRRRDSFLHGTHSQYIQ